MKESNEHASAPLTKGDFIMSLAKKRFAAVEKGVTSQHVPGSDSGVEVMVKLVAIMKVEFQRLE